MNRRIKTGETSVDGTLVFIDTTSSQTTAKPYVSGSSNENILHWLVGHLVSRRFETGHNETVLMAEEIYNTLVQSDALSGKFCPMNCH